MRVFLLAKLERLGVGRKALRWLSSYLTGGKRCVEWNDTRSDFVVVRYGVRQCSILGPMLYLIHVADMPNVVGLADDKNSGYADNMAMWAIGKTVQDEVVSKLNVLAGKFATYAKGNGLALLGCVICSVTLLKILVAPVYDVVESSS
jgi:hypothetical protein